MTDEPPTEAPGAPAPEPIEPTVDPSGPAADAEPVVDAGADEPVVDEPTMDEPPTDEPAVGVGSIRPPHRSWLGGIVGVLLALVMAAGLGFGAATVLVPRLADASPPPPTPVPTASPTPTPPPTPSPSASSSPSSSSTAGPTPRPSTTFYVVQKGDILSAIAQRFGVSVAAIVTANGLTDPNHIETGQRLIIPAPTPSPSPTLAPTPTS